MPASQSAAKSRSPRISLLPRIALWTLDIFCILGFLGFLFAFVRYIRDDAVQANLVSIILSFILGFLILTFFWMGHLLLRRTISGQPFERRNVRLIYVLAVLALLWAIVNGMTLSWNWTTTTPAGATTGSVSAPTTNLTPKTKFTLSVKYKKNYKDFTDFMVRSGIFYGLLLLAFAAIFQRGVELHEEEDRLRAEQALTI